LGFFFSSEKTKTSSLSSLTAVEAASLTALASLTISQAGSLLLDQDVEALQTCYEQAIPRRMGGDLVQNDRSL